MDKWMIGIAEHIFAVETDSAGIRAFMEHKYPVYEPEDGREADFTIAVHEGYGRGFVDYNVEASLEDNVLTFTRADYVLRIRTDADTAELHVYDDFSLKHAMLNLYSWFIVNRGWGLLIHSSCIVEREKAYVFAGHSGAGKSTVAKLSMPRPILSDEATIAKVTEDGVTIYHSPFRSELESPHHTLGFPLAAVQILHQSLQNKRSPMNKVDGVMQLLGKLFYWPYDPAETKKVLKLSRLLLERTPIYALYFQKNDTFWEEIS